MMEGNVVQVCTHCKEEELKAFQADLTTHINEITSKLVNKEAVFVKWGFPIRNSEMKEYMWVRVQSIHVQERVISGVLDNEPGNDVGYEYGHIVEVPFNEIQDALWRGKMPNILNNHHLH
jgi:uncharacterized protein YegJ (DUF2314 family)